VMQAPFTDQDLLDAAERVLRDAVETAEFTRHPKDVQYVNIVSEKLEKHRAGMQGYAVPIKRVFTLQGGRRRMMVETTMDHTGPLLRCQDPTCKDCH
jgi:hypothetical protein